MVTFTLIALAGILSFLAMRSAFWILKFMAGMSWWALAIWWITNPIITAGSPAQVAVLIILFGLGLIIPILGMGYDYKKQENGVTSNGFSWSLPKFLRGENEEKTPSLGRKGRNSLYARRVNQAMRRYRR